MWRVYMSQGGATAHLQEISGKQPTLPRSTETAKVMEDYRQSSQNQRQERSSDCSSIPNAAPREALQQQLSFAGCLYSPYTRTDTLCCAARAAAGKEEKEKEEYEKEENEKEENEEKKEKNEEKEKKEEEENEEKEKKERKEKEKKEGKEKEKKEKEKKEENEEKGKGGAKARNRRAV
ncbi:hypothetical protein cyc_00275 [Cyclospora cayetanensis]|uniref:Uncharacterized protein n=1 Tax=Cyclospora cayetanensis TaxID=88456 RepID=A0A1D3CTC0_9EIME|nr:hypothetical protein cyc_00275 [Cyclospora cayetanensis]